MNEIQRNVIFVFQRNEHLKKNIIRTCRENATVSTNLTNSSIDVSGLVNNLHVSIINYEAVYKPQTPAIYVQENDNETYFVDRQYRGRGGRYFQTFKSSTFRKKRCFVCSRENCWSINHIQQERDDANKRFGDRYFQLRARADYIRKLIQYITDLEGGDDEMIQYFEKLQVDSDFKLVSEISETFNVHEEDDEMFCISLGTLTNVDCMLTTKLLANHAAKHQITGIDESENSPSTKNSGTENSSTSYAYTSEDDSSNGENPRISDVSDFSEHPISPGANGEISEHPTSPEANAMTQRLSQSNEAGEDLANTRQEKTSTPSPSRLMLIFSARFPPIGNRFRISHT